jgi:hypothetical protein
VLLLILRVLVLSLCGLAFLHAELSRQHDQQAVLGGVRWRCIRH